MHALHLPRLTVHQSLLDVSMVLLYLGLTWMLSMASNHAYHRVFDHQKIFCSLPLKFELFNIFPLHIEVLLSELFSNGPLFFFFSFSFSILFVFFVFCSLILHDLSLELVIPLNSSFLHLFFSFHFLF